MLLLPQMPGVIGGARRVGGTGEPLAPPFPDGKILPRGSGVPLGRVRHRGQLSPCRGDVAAEGEPLNQQFGAAAARHLEGSGHGEPLGTLLKPRVTVCGGDGGLPRGVHIGLRHAEQQPQTRRAPAVSPQERSPAPFGSAPR